MQNNFKYINLSWAVVGFCEAPHQPLSSCIPGIDKDEAAAVEHYVIGYMAFWHIAFVNEDHLVPYKPLHCRPSASRDLSPLLPRPAPSADSPDGSRRHEPRVPDVTLRNVTNPMNICSDFHLGRHFSAFAEGFFFPFL